MRCEMENRVLATTLEIPLGGVKIVKVDRREIGIFNVEGEFRAYANVCVHEGGPVCLGMIGGTYLPSDAHEYEYGLEGRVLRCPWHHWEFDLKSGRCIWGGKQGLVSYRVEVKDGQVSVFC